MQSHTTPASQECNTIQTKSLFMYELDAGVQFVATQEPNYLQF
jgi:hypothetical protein